MRYVIVAKSPVEKCALQYFAGDGFRPNLLQAARFRTVKDALRRSEKSLHCHRMAESGAKLDVIKIGQKETTCISGSPAPGKV